MHDMIKETVKENKGMVISSDNPGEKCLQFYFENRAKINNLYNIAQTARDWLNSIFCKSSFVWEHRIAEPVHTNRTEDKHRYAIYRLSDIVELVVVVNYEALWNSNPGESYLRFYFEPLEPWIEPTVNTETKTHSNQYWLPSKNNDKRFWHCESIEINIPEASLQSEERLKDCIAQILLDPESRLVVRARELANTLSNNHKPSYKWEDALYVLQTLAPEDDEDNALFWCNPIDFVSFDEKTHIVVLEVIDNLFRNHLEHSYNSCLSTAIKYAFGDDARYSILCRQLMY